MSTGQVNVAQLRSSAGIYGAERMLLNLNKSLPQAGVHSQLLCINNYLQSKQALHELAMLNKQSVALLPCAGKFDIATAKALKLKARSDNLQIIHSHDYKSAFYSSLAALGSNVKRVATLHGWVETSTSLKIYQLLERVLLRSFDALVVVAQNQMQRLLQLGIPQQRIHYIANAIDVPAAEIVQVKSKAGIEGLYADALVFGFVGRLAAEKNVAMLISAFAKASAKYDRLQLVITGDGPDKDMLQQHARSLSIDDRVIFTGARGDMDRVYSAIDYVLLPSLTEGMPMVVLEAMANEIPVIASAVGEIPALLKHTNVGIVLEPGNEQALTDALYCAAQTGSIRDRAGREHILANHTSSAMAVAYADLYRMLA